MSEGTVLATKPPQANGRHAPATSPDPAGREYRVRSLAVAAALRCAGAVYLGPAAGADGWIEFRFADAGEARQLIHRYWNGQLEPVQPRDLLGALIELRAALREAKEAANAAPAAGDGEGER